MLRKIIQLNELGLPLIDLNKSPKEIKEDIISYVLKADKLPLLSKLNAQTSEYLFEQPIDKYLDINDVLSLLRDTATGYYTNEIIEKYFFDEKSAELIINEYKNNFNFFKHADVHKLIVKKLYLKYKEISDEEFIKRLNVFYKKYQPIKLFGQIYNQNKEYAAHPRLPNMTLKDSGRVYHGAWILLKAMFTFYNDRLDCINNFFSRPIEYSYNPWQKSVKTKLNYSLDNITDILSGLRHTHSTFLMDEFLSETFKIDSQNVSDSVGGLFIPFPAIAR